MRLGLRDHEDVFVRTWDLVEDSYEGLFEQRNGKGCEAVVELVREMRRRGYDRVFRAGMAAFSLVLSQRHPSTDTAQQHLALRAAVYAAADRPLIKPRRSA